MKWRELGSGSYNTTYVSEDGKFVFKVAHDDSPTDLPDRSKRLWNLLNSHIQPPAKISRQKINGRWRTGWLCPFIRGREANDDEIRDELLNIFNRTGRIITDATAPKNFITTPSGQTVCIDVGHALEMEQRESMALLGLSRKPSLTSLETWEALYDTKKGKKWMKDNKKFSPKAIKTVEALLFIKQYRPDITNVNFLKKSPKAIKLLADAHEKKTPSLVNQAFYFRRSRERCNDNRGRAWYFFRPFDIK